MPATERVFWRSDTATVRVGYNEAGELEFFGYDRAHLDGYEYTISVAAHEFVKLRAALGADSGVDVVDLVCAHADEIMAVGERSWLDDHGIERGFASY